MTQILDLTLLAPDLQEEVLLLDDGESPSERDLRTVFRLSKWEAQASAFHAQLLRTS
jgi:hypothetical protein